MVNLFVPMGGFACLTESGVCFRYVAKKTLEFLENFKFFQTKDFELSEKGNCLFHTKF